MQTFILEKPGFPNQYFQEDIGGMKVGTNPANLVLVGYTLARMKWQSFEKNGYIQKKEFC